MAASRSGLNNTSPHPPCLVLQLRSRDALRHAQVFMRFLFVYKGSKQTLPYFPISALPPTPLPPPTPSQASFPLSLSPLINNFFFLFPHFHRADTLPPLNPLSQSFSISNFWGTQVSGCVCGWDSYFLLLYLCVMLCIFHKTPLFSLSFMKFIHCVRLPLFFT